jgi:hypothetical protein
MVADERRLHRRRPARTLPDDGSDIGRWREGGEWL